MKPILSQLLATAQLAEMAYTADPADHKKTAWEKALADYEQAAGDQEPEPVLTLPANPKDVAFLERLSQELEQESQRLKSENAELKTENSLLKNQLIEKEGKIKTLENSVTAGAPGSAKSTVTEPAPAATPKPLTGAAKLAAEKKAAAAAATATESTGGESTAATDDEKKS